VSSSQWDIPYTNIFFSPTQTCHDETPNQEEEEEENITVNIYSYNLNGSNMCDL